MSYHLSLSVAAYGEVPCFRIEDVKISKIHIAQFYFLL